MKHEWQPVSTAPKDGTPVFVTWRGSRSRAVGRAAVWNPMRFRTLANGDAEDEGAGWVCYYTGTHLTERIDYWMPLPKPPEDQS